MSVQLDALTAQVTTNNNLLASATQMINGIAAQITAAGTDPVALQNLTDSLQTSDATLAAAVLANTPVVVVPSTSTTTGTSVPSGTTITTAPSTGTTQGTTVPVVTTAS